MWGQSTATKVLIDSLIALKGDGSVIIGRGIPNGWVRAGGLVEVTNFPIRAGRKMNFSLEGVSSSEINLTLSGDDAGGEGTILDLRALKNNISSASGLPYDFENGTVTLPPGRTTALVTMVTANPTPIPIPTPVPPITVEAESAQLHGCSMVSDPQASGGARVEGIDTVGDYVLFQHVPAAHHIAFKYSWNPPGPNQPLEGTMSLYIGNNAPTRVRFFLTGQWSAPFAWQDVAIDIPPNAPVKLQLDPGDVAKISLDYIRIW
jgi:hypothetical protein